METIELARTLAPVILFVMMIGMGLGLEVADFANLFRAPAGVVIGTLGQLVVLPLLGVWVTWLFALEGALALGVIILALCPGGVASNTITYLVKGDVALSISLTVISSCVAFVSVPLLASLALAHFGLFSHEVHLPMGETVWRLFLLTLLPLALGMLIARQWPSASVRLQKPLRLLGFAFLMLMILTVVVREYALLEDYASRLGASLLVLFGATMGLAWVAAWLAGLGRAQRRSITVEIGIQNSALAMVIASLIGSVDMAIAAIIYSVMVCLIALLGVCAHAWFTRQSRVTDPLRAYGQHACNPLAKD